MQAAAQHGVSLAESWMIGDAPSDIEAGRNAGYRTVWIRSEDNAYPELIRADLSARSLAEATDLILLHERTAMAS